MQKLFDLANQGIAFEKWKLHPCTQLLLEALQNRAESAREVCVELSPYTDPDDLAEQQAIVKTYKLMIAEIHAFIEQGNKAERELETLKSGHMD